MHISPDHSILWEAGFVKINATMVTTWAIMIVLTAGSMLITGRQSIGMKRSRWRNFLEILVVTFQKQIQDAGLCRPRRYVSFLGTILLFAASSALCTVLPGYEPPTGSLSTTAALAICVFVAVPVYGIAERGLSRYLASYVKPIVIMLPFNIIGEVTRTLAMAVRLFGNMMSGTMIVATLLTIAPFIFPAAMTALGLLTGMVQSYIFSLLAAVYISAAVRAHDDGAG
jgi:F-type H+-transporting ATPase subunit a